MRFLFNEDKNAMVLTTNEVLEKKDRIYAVYHDSDDGMWQFIGKMDCDNSNARLVSLEEICILDDSVNDLAELPCGYMAQRNNDKWIISKYE